MTNAPGQVNLGRSVDGLTAPRPAMTNEPTTGQEAPHLGPSRPASHVEVREWPLRPVVG